MTSSRPSSKDIVTWAKILLKRKKIQTKFSAWARLYSVVPADIRMNAFSVAFGGKADMPFRTAYVGL